MFQSPLKTVSEKIKPVSSKSSISSVKFDRASDFKKFINFIKKETKELEKIKIPKVSEVKGKSKRKGFFGLAALGIFGLLASGFGDGDGEEKKRFGLAGGTESQFKDIGLPLIRGLKRVPKDPPRIRTRESLLRKSLNQSRRNERLKNIKKYQRVKVKYEKIKDKLFKQRKRGRKVEKKFAKKIMPPTQLNIMEESNLVEKLKKSLVNGEIFDPPKPQLNPRDQFAEEIRKQDAKGAFADTDELVKKAERELYGKVKPETYTKEEFKIAEENIAKSQKEFEKTVKQLKEIRAKKRGSGFFNFNITGKDPKLQIGGFTPKDTLNKMFTGIGKKTKTFRDNLSAGFSKIPIPKKVVSIAKPFLKKGAFVFDFATAGVELYKILEGFVVGDNILTSFYDLGVSIHNTFQPDKAKLITYITNSRDPRLKAIKDQQNQKILNQIQQAQQAQTSNNNVSPKNQTSNIIPLATQAGTNAMIIPLSPSFMGFKFIMDKLYRQ